MATRRARAWTLFVGTLTATAITYFLAILNHGTRHGATASWNGLREITSWQVLMVTAAGLGVLVATRRAENILADVLALSGFIGTVVVSGDQYAGLALVARPGVLAGGVAARIISHVTFASTWFSAGVLIPALFPTGRLVSRRWRFVIWIGGAGALAWAAIVVLPQAFTTDELLGKVPGVRNPIGIRPIAATVDVVGDLGVLLLFAGMFLAIVSLVVRAVRAHSEERQQVKVVAYTVGITTIVQLVAANVQEQLRLPYAVLTVISDLCLFAIVASIGIALLRYRLYDVDRVINRTIVYAVVTAVLAGAYAGVVLLLGLATRSLVRGSDLAVAVSTLFVFAIFNPVRRVVQRFVDRRFYRSRYDAARTLEAFAAQVRRQTDLVALSREIQRVASDALHPARVGLWLRADATMAISPELSVARSAHRR